MLAGDLANEDREEDLEDITDDDKDEVVQDGIESQVRDFRMQQEFKVLESDIGARKQGIPEIELGEGEVDADHGQVIVDEEEDKAGDQEEEQDPVPSQFLKETVFPAEKPLSLFHGFAGDVADDADYEGRVDWKPGVEGGNTVMMIGEQEQTERSGSEDEGEKHAGLEAAVHAEQSVFRCSFVPEEEKCDAPDVEDDSTCSDEEQDEGP